MHELHFAPPKKPWLKLWFVGLKQERWESETRSQSPLANGIPKPVLELLAGQAELQSSRRQSNQTEARTPRSMSRPGVESRRSAGGPGFWAVRVRGSGDSGALVSKDCGGGRWGQVEGPVERSVSGRSSGIFVLAAGAGLLATLFLSGGLLGPRGVAGGGVCLLGCFQTCGGGGGAEGCRVQ